MSKEAATSALQKAIDANSLAIADITKSTSAISSNIFHAEVQAKEFQDTIAKLRAELIRKEEIASALRDERAYLTNQLVNVTNEVVM